MKPGAPIAALAALALSAALAGCGSDSTKSTNFGSPPDASVYATGDGSSGSGYGSGGGSPGADASIEAGGALCPIALTQCPENFAYPYNGETSVSLMGAFTAGGWTTGVPMTLAGGEWQVQAPVPYDQAIEYKFLVNGTSWVTDPDNPNTVTDTGGNIDSVKAGITCKDPTCAEPPVPPPGVYDWRDAVIYYVFVDRFLDGEASNNCNVAGVPAVTNYMGGDWAGVTQKISSGYFNDLGVNTLWITVPFKNSDTYAGQGANGDPHYYSAYHGYWPTDLSSYEPCFGTEAELLAMVSAAHAKNLKVLFDLVGVDVESESSTYTSNTDWFWPNSSPAGNCICGDGCSYSTDAQICWFASYLPHWNYTVSAARDFSVNAAVALAKNTGVDGFRMDAVYQIDTSWFLELRSQIQSQIVANEKLQQRFYMVGETYNFSDRALIASYVNPATLLDGQFDFPLRYQLVTAILLKQQGLDALASFMDTNDDYYGVDAVMSPFIGNQDLPRSIELATDTPVFTNPYDDGSELAWSGDSFAGQTYPLPLPTEMSAFQRLANAYALLLTNRGAPLIYYGDEIGMPGAGDPDNRRFMQWSGLSSNQTFLYDRMKTLLAIRAAHPALRRGTRATINVTADVWVYSMTTSGDTVYVAMNRSDDDATVMGLPSGPLNELVTATTTTGPTFLVPARETRIFTTM